jgi:site-specific recombinase XerD
VNRRGRFPDPAGLLSSGQALAPPVPGKGGKEKEIPVHHKLEEYLDVYLKAAKLSEQPASPLFRYTRGRSRELGADALSRKDAWAMLKRRLRDAGLSTIYCNHSFRAAASAILTPGLFPHSQ